MRPCESSRSSSLAASRPAMMSDTCPFTAGRRDGMESSTARSISPSDTSRCCAPSCRSRSKRRRASSAAATIRAREAISSARASAFAIAVATSSAKPVRRDSVSGGGGCVLEDPTITVPHKRPSTVTSSRQVARGPRSARKPADHPHRGRCAHRVRTGRLRGHRSFGVRRWHTAVRPRGSPAALRAGKRTGPRRSRRALHPTRLHHDR